MAIVTKGYGSRLAITQGYGTFFRDPFVWSDILEATLNHKSMLDKTVTLKRTHTASVSLDRTIEGGQDL